MDLDIPLKPEFSRVSISKISQYCLKSILQFGSLVLSEILALSQQCCRVLQTVDFTDPLNPGPFHFILVFLQLGCNLPSSIHA